MRIQPIDKVSHTANVSSELELKNDWIQGQNILPSAKHCTGKPWHFQVTLEKSITTSVKPHTVITPHSVIELLFYLITHPIQPVQRFTQTKYFEVNTRFRIRES